MKILLSGLYRTGNNWLIFLLENNFSNITLKQTHFFSPDIEGFYSNFDLCILIYKNPYNWVNSIIKQSWDMPFYYDLEPSKECHTIDINIEYPMEKIKQKSVKKTHTISLQKLINCYNNYFYYWTNQTLSNKNRKYIFVQYEDILTNPEKFVDILSCKTDLEKKSIFKDSDSVINSRDWKSNKKDIYLNTPIIDKKILPIINKSLDANVMKLLGFQYLN
jgi:hypothetical protein